MSAGGAQKFVTYTPVNKLIRLQLSNAISRAAQPYTSVLLYQAIKIFDSALKDVCSEGTSLDMAAYASTSYIPPCLLR